jgi:hypothetical protein
MINESGITRVNLRLSTELVDWCKAEAKKEGITLTFLVYMALSQFRDQRTAIKEMPATYEKIAKLLDDVKVK